MKIKIIALPLLLAVTFLSCKKEELFIPENNFGTPLTLLSQVTIDNQPSAEYVYNESKLIIEEKSKFNFTAYHYNSKNQLVTTEYYSNNDIIKQ